MGRHRKKKTNPKKVAKHLPRYMQDIVFSKRFSKGGKHWRKGTFGKLGAASEVRVLVKDGEVLK